MLLAPGVAMEKVRATRRPPLPPKVLRYKAMVDTASLAASGVGALVGCASCDAGEVKACGLCMLGWHDHCAQPLVQQLLGNSSGNEELLARARRMELAHGVDQLQAAVGSAGSLQDVRPAWFETCPMCNAVLVCAAELKREVSASAGEEGACEDIADMWCIPGNGFIICLFLAPSLSSFACLFAKLSPKCRHLSRICCQKFAFFSQKCRRFGQTFGPLSPVLRAFFVRLV